MEKALVVQKKSRTELTELTQLTLRFANGSVS